MRALLPRIRSWVPAVMLLWLAAQGMVALAAGGGAAAGGAVEIPAAPPGPGRATVLEINGPIGPATSSYIVRGLSEAAKNGSPLVILQLDTPGGLDVSMRDMIQAILASPVPVIGYVYPPGSRAASAGTYILYATHVAAMAPATELGAATPVSIGGDDPAPEPAASPSSGEATSGSHSASASAKSSGSASASSPSATGAETPAVPKAGSAMEHKVVNDAVAYIRSLAELRGRNAQWAESAVRGAASLPANAALAQNVVDLIAPDMKSLLQQLDGREVRGVAGHTVKLATRDLALTASRPDWRTRLLAVITNPTVAYGLLLIGIYGLLFEGYNPGGVLPGVVGAIALLLALFAFQILSVNYAGLALIVVGVVMIVSEFFMPAYGSLGVGGLVAFVVGSVMLFDSGVPGMSLGWPLIAGIATAAGLLLIGMIYLVTRSALKPVVTGKQGMLGKQAVVFESFRGEGNAPCEGKVRLGGEIWNAVSHHRLEESQKVQIVKVDGLTVHVEPLTEGVPAAVGSNAPAAQVR